MPSFKQKTNGQWEVIEDTPVATATEPSVRLPMAESLHQLHPLMVPQLGRQFVVCPMCLHKSKTLRAYLQHLDKEHFIHYSIAGLEMI